jgi:hypothetical protein
MTSSMALAALATRQTRARSLWEAFLGRKKSLES